jgi:hypothetical protein
MEGYLSVYKVFDMPRVKLYFFDYRFFSHMNTFHILNHIKEVFNSPTDYTNFLSQNIIEYKSDNSITGD